MYPILEHKNLALNKILVDSPKMKPNIKARELNPYLIEQKPTLGITTKVCKLFAGLE